MKNPTPEAPALTRNFSLWLAASVMISFVALFLSSESPFVLMLPVLYGASFLLPSRLPRDSASIWGLRLFVYAGCAVLGRTGTGMPNYFYDARAFTSLGLIIGGELVLQAFREPPRDLRFDPNQILLAGIIFLISCNTTGTHIFLFAPLIILTLLFALNDLRLRAGKVSINTQIKRGSLIGLTVVAGVLMHQMLWANRSTIMVLGAQLLSASHYQPNAGGTEVGDNPQLSSNFAAGTSTARLLKIEGTLNDPHLRTAAFDDYVDGAWGPRISSRTITAALPQDTKEELTKGGDLRTDYNAKITVLRETNKVMFAPLNVAAIVPLAGTSFDWYRYAGPIQIDETPPISYGIVEGKDEILGVPVTQGPLCVAPDAQQREQLLKIPASIDPKVVALAQEITRTAPSQAEKIEAILEYFQQNHKYSLDFVRGKQDPVSDFLLNKKSAHCQYFASGAVMLMRAVGIPARYVSGFYAHEVAGDGTEIVRGRDAHAWAEAYVDGVGWVEVEATPPSGRADPEVSPLPWYQRAMEWAQDSFARVRGWLGGLTNVQILGLMLLVLAIWGVERWRQGWKKRHQKSTGPQVPLELQPLARRFERALAKRGITLRPGQPWSERVPPDWEKARDWIELYNHARFAERNEAELTELERELSKVEVEK